MLSWSIERFCNLLLKESLGSTSLVRIYATRLVIPEEWDCLFERDRLVYPKHQVGSPVQETLRLYSPDLRLVEIDCNFKVQFDGKNLILYFIFVCLYYRFLMFVVFLLESMLQFDMLYRSSTLWLRYIENFFFETVKYLV